MEETIWNNTTYSSRKACYEDLGISYNGLMKRLRKGYTCDDDVGPRKKPCKFNGKWYESQREAAEASGYHPTYVGKILHGRKDR